MTIKTYRKIALMRAVWFIGTEENAEEIAEFMRTHRGMHPDESRRAIGFIMPDFNMIDVTEGGPNGLTEDEFCAHEVLFQDPEVKAVIWNDLHRYWNPLRLTDHVALDSQGCFYPIADSDVISSYTEVGKK